ncbi:MAG: DoxX family protein [Rhabdochlamydiaceae bacterium]|nr:DoxX family protein [Rhabdochlamydiaceae bacterium]
MKKILMLVGRICISLVFVTSALSKIFSWDQTVQFMTGSLSKLIAGTPMPDFMHGAITFICSYAVFFLIIATIFEVVGGLLVLLGFNAQFGAILLILFLLPVTIIMHPFWLESGQEKTTQLAHFMTNLAILGGLFILVAKGGDSEVS